jgi:hypothetical protein
MAFLVSIEWHTATRVIGVYDASAVKTFALGNPAFALSVPACAHVRASGFMARHAIDCHHRALIAMDSNSLWSTHQRTPAFSATPMATITLINAPATYRRVDTAI